jgi:OOP family OmpA-OmpF porin
MNRSKFHTRSSAQRLAQAATLLLLPLAALAQAKPGYVLDGQGDFVRSGTPGQCWHDGQWTPAMAQAPCDAVLQPLVVAPAPVAAAQPAPQPPVVAAAPKAAPVPVLVPAPAPAPILRYAADTLFGFDKFSISADGKKVLDEASVTILGLKGDKVEVVGHADRIGSTAYNQKLSLQRANAVRDYLSAKGVPADHMRTRGAGEAEPVTAAGTCTKGSSAQVIACLQPDRRVDIVVQGTQIAKP